MSIPKSYVKVGANVEGLSIVEVVVEALVKLIVYSLPVSFTKLVSTVNASVVSTKLSRLIV